MPQTSTINDFAPYTNFDNTVIVLSTILSPSAFTLYAHWTSPTSPWPLPSKRKDQPIAAGPFHLHTELMSWRVPDELHMAKAGLEAATEYVANGLEPRLKMYMQILDGELRRKEGLGWVGDRAVVRRGDLAWM